MSKEYQERIKPIKEDGIRSIEAEIEYKKRKVGRLRTFFKSDKHLRAIESRTEEITKLKERLEKRIKVSQ